MCPDERQRGPWSSRESRFIYSVTRLSFFANHHSHCPYKSENHDQTLLSSMLLYACYSTFNVEFNLMQFSIDIICTILQNVNCVQQIQNKCATRMARDAMSFICKTVLTDATTT